MIQEFYEGLDETVCRQTLPNGLRVAVLPRKGFSKKLAYFVTDFGSIHTDFRFEGREHHVPGGIAHYLEHKMFDLPGDRDVSEEFSVWGASTNAFTSYDMTAYYFSCTDHFEDCLHLLLEFVSTPYFTKESVEKERGIIDQEIGMNRDAADSVVFENLAKVLYSRHPIRVPILGTSESIRDITPEDLYLCHRAFYTPGNMMLCVVGDVDPEAVCQMAREVLGDEPREVGEKIQDWEEPLTSPQPLTKARMEVSMPTFTLAFKCAPLGRGEEAIRREMVADLAAEALFGESSDLYLQMYDRGIIDGSFGGGFETIDGCALFTCGGDSMEPEAVLTAVLEGCGRLLDQGLSQKDFSRMKRSALGRRIRSLDSFDATCFRVCAYALTGFDYFRFPQVYETIEKEDIEDFLRETVRQDRCCLSVIEPIRKEHEA